MKKQINAITIATYVAGILAVSCAVIVLVLYTLSALGLFEPKKTRITVSSSNIESVYNDHYVFATDPYISIGKLQKGHEMIVISRESYIEVGTHLNECDFVIIDSTGADVTEMYDITRNFGKLIIKGIPLLVTSNDKTMGYNGTPLVCDSLHCESRKLLSGHTFTSLAETSITEPGSVEIEPEFIITDINGTDVTDTYDVTLKMGTLTVEPIPITVQTGSSSKKYDGKPLSNDKWEIVSGTLLSGHKLTVNCYTEVVEPGVYDNLAHTGVKDSQGRDVSNLYNIQFTYGALDIAPITLHINTGSATKEYDGSPLTNDTWHLISGQLAQGESLKVASVTEAFNAGTVSNNITFVIVDENGNDLTSRYKIVLSPGSLTITPRNVVIQTGSASKVYDGTELKCELYEIIRGSVCPGDIPEFLFTSITDIGYSDNYIINKSVFFTAEDGTRIDVTKNYKFTFLHGKLSITAD